MKDRVSFLGSPVLDVENSGDGDCITVNAVYAPPPRPVHLMRQVMVRCSFRLRRVSTTYLCRPFSLLGIILWPCHRQLTYRSWCISRLQEVTYYERDSTSYSASWWIFKEVVRTTLTPTFSARSSLQKAVGTNVTDVTIFLQNKKKMKAFSKLHKPLDINMKYISFRDTAGIMDVCAALALSSSRLLGDVEGADILFRNKLSWQVYIQFRKHKFTDCNETST